MAVSLQLNPASINTVFHKFGNVNKLAFSRVLQRYHKQNNYSSIHALVINSLVVAGPNLNESLEEAATAYIRRMVDKHGNVKRPAQDHTKVPEEVKIPFHWLLLNNIKHLPKYSMHFIKLSTHAGVPNIICFLDMGVLQIIALKCMWIKVTDLGLEVYELGYGTFSEGQLKECLRLERPRFVLKKQQKMKELVRDLAENANGNDNGAAAIRYMQVRNQYFNRNEFVISNADIRRKVTHQREQMTFSLLETCVHELNHRCTEEWIKYYHRVQQQVPDNMNNDGEDAEVQIADNVGGNNVVMNAELTAYMSNERGKSKALLVLGADFVSKDRVCRSHANGLRSFNFPFKTFCDFLLNSNKITCLRLNEAYTSQTCPR